MRVLVEPQTGELYEVQDADLVGGEPYDYAGYRRAQMAATREHRKALRDFAEAATAAARTEREYRRAISVHLPAVKAEHGATVAEAMVKGVQEVGDAYEAKLAAEALERAAMEYVRLCRDDRMALNAMGGWSREADPDGWRNAGGGA